MICEGAGCAGWIPCCFSCACAAARFDDSASTTFACCFSWFDVACRLMMVYTTRPRITSNTASRICQRRSRTARVKVAISMGSP